MACDQAAWLAKNNKPPIIDEAPQFDPARPVASWTARPKPGILAAVPKYPNRAAVAQWIEYWPPKPRVAGSIPASRASLHSPPQTDHLQPIPATPCTLGSNGMCPASPIKLIGSGFKIRSGLLFIPKQFELERRRRISGIDADEYRIRLTFSRHHQPNQLAERFALGVLERTVGQILVRIALNQ